MTWHILYFVYCIDQVAWALSYCQEDSFVGFIVFWAWRKSQGRVENLALDCRHRDAHGVPVAACRWRAGLSHLLSPRKLHIFQREKGDSAVPYITAKASLYPSDIHLPLRSRYKTVWKHKCTPDLWVGGGFVCVLVCAHVLKSSCFRHASPSSCEQSVTWDASCTEQNRWVCQVGERILRNSIDCCFWSAGAGW